MQIEPIKIYPQPPINKPCFDPANFPNYAQEARNSANEAAAASVAAMNYSKLAEDALDDFINYAYSKAETDLMLETKADSADLDDYYDKAEIDALLTDFYDKNTIDSLLSNKVNNSALNNYYTKSESDVIWAAKANVSDLNDYYTKTAANAILTDFAVNITHSIGSVTIAAGSTYTNAHFDFSSYVPDGYKAIAVYPASAGNNHTYYYNCSKNDGADTAILMIKNTNTSSVTVTPYIHILCIKEV